MRVGKIKKSDFQKLYVRWPGNRKHSFFTTETDPCSNYAIQLNQMSNICEVWKN